MAVVQRTAVGSNPCISHVVSKSDRDHRTATTDNRTIGLTLAGTTSRSNLSLGLYPILRALTSHLVWISSLLRGGGGAMQDRPIPSSPLIIQLRLSALVMNVFCCS